VSKLQIWPPVQLPSVPMGVRQISVPNLVNF
jgi:hypothetical protein